MGLRLFFFDLVEEEPLVDILELAVTVAAGDS